jgi:hypothetical protein
VKKQTEKLSYALEEAFDVIGVNRSAGYKLMADGKLETFIPKSCIAATQRTARDTAAARHSIHSFAFFA